MIQTGFKSKRAETLQKWWWEAETRFKDHLWGTPTRRSKEEDGKPGKDTEGVSGRSWRRLLCSGKKVDREKRVATASKVASGLRDAETELEIQY